MWRFAAWSPRTKKVVTSLAIWPAAAWWLWRAGAPRWQTAAAAGAGALWVLIIIGVFVAPSTDSDDAAPGEPAAAAAQATPATPSAHASTERHNVRAAADPEPDCDRCKRDPKTLQPDPSRCDPEPGPDRRDPEPGPDRRDPEPDPGRADSHADTLHERPLR